MYVKQSTSLVCGIFLTCQLAIKDILQRPNQSYLVVFAGRKWQDRTTNKTMASKFDSMREHSVIYIPWFNWQVCGIQTANQIKIARFFQPGPYHPPVYNGVGTTSSRYEIINNQHIFTVVQGSRFYLKLNLSANPPPNNDSLSKNGTVLQRSPWGNINLGVDSVNIQTVQFTDEAKYTISCSNSMGTANFSFQLKVVGKNCKSLHLMDEIY